MASVNFAGDRVTLLGYMTMYMYDNILKYISTKIFTSYIIAFCKNFPPVRLDLQSHINQGFV